MPPTKKGDSAWVPLEAKFDERINGTVTAKTRVRRIKVKTSQGTDDAICHELKGSGYILCRIYENIDPAKPVTVMTRIFRTMTEEATLLQQNLIIEFIRQNIGVIQAVPCALYRNLSVWGIDWAVVKTISSVIS